MTDLVQAPDDFSTIQAMRESDMTAPRVLYMWEYNGRLVISFKSRVFMPDTSLDDNPLVLHISATHMYPDYGTLIRKRAWFQALCANMGITLFEE